jgi:hypothetical protein
MAAKNVSSNDIQKFLSGMEFPTNKQQIISFAKSKGASNEVVSALNGLPDREYSNSADISGEIEE